MHSNSVFKSMKSIYCLVGIGCFLMHCSFCFGQNDSISMAAFYSDVMLNAVEAEHRDYAEHQLYSIIKESLSDGNISDLQLDNLDWIYKHYAVDSSFVLLSWKVELEDRISRYRNFLVKNDSTFVEFQDGGNTLLQDGEYIINEPSNNLSAIYYKMIPQYDLKGEPDSYLLFGLRTFDRYENIKLIEILDLSSGEISLGKPIFQSRDDRGNIDTKTRLILKYAIDSQVAFTYNPNSKMIIYDHLIPRMGRLEGQGPTMLPDGSYEAYFYDRGKWLYKEKVFDQISKEAPMPNPVLDKKDKDIFGRGG